MCVLVRVCVCGPVCVYVWSSDCDCVDDIDGIQVNFSEPLSFLQRLTEDFEYSDCLDNAAQCTDRFEQLAYVAAFAVSSYANTTVRTGKPFNPLLGETYECDRFDELGWRAFTEQVGHSFLLASYQVCLRLDNATRHWATSLFDLAFC